MTLTEKMLMRGSLQHTLDILRPQLVKLTDTRKHAAAASLTYRIATKSETNVTTAIQSLTKAIDALR